MYIGKNGLVPLNGIDHLTTTRPYALGKLLLFSDLGSGFGGMVLCIIHAYGSKNVTDMGKTRL